MPNRSLDFTACNLPCEHPCWRRLTKEEIEWLEKTPNRQAYTLVCIEKRAKEIVDNKIQTNLTEQWRKGELPEGWYYVIKTGDVEMLEYSCNCFLAVDVPLIDNEVTEVLAPVPSYEEWEQLQNWADFTDDYHALREQKEIAEYEKVELKETVEALKSELKEVCDVLIRKCPEMKEWVMLNWKNLYEVDNDSN